MFRTSLAALLVLLSTLTAKAQESFWVQIAARPTLAEATDYARTSSARLSGVHGFYLGNGFYAIAIGPFSRPEAESARLRLLSSASIPSDSFVKDGRGFDRQFWPIGGGIASPAPQANSQPPVQTITEIPDETVREARNSESRLTRTEREELQRALQWAGFYNAAIDGAFGRGTRAAMEAWQIASAKEPTGVLTTRQRAELLRDYNAVLDALDMKIARDRESGIEMRIPTAAVAFTEYQPPFVKFEAIGEVPDARVLFISQRGDADQLRGLYEIMQSLDIVPVEGERRLRGDSFFIEGADDDIISFTEVALRDGEIKGFTVVWPASDKPTRDRMLAEMRTSFLRLEGTLDPNIVPLTEEQSIDMVSGLAIRQPRLSRSGFYVTDDGRVLTTSEAVDDCTRITLDRDTNMQVIANDPIRGIALLGPVDGQTPLTTARFDQGTMRLRARVAVAGFSYGGVLADPTLTFGEVADLRNLAGDTTQKRLDMIVQPSDAGGPILNNAGQVTGMLLPSGSANGQTLPEGVSFALKSSELAAFLAENEVIVADTDAGEDITPVAMTRLAADLGVLVSCW